MYFGLMYHNHMMFISFVIVISWNKMICHKVLPWFMTKLLGHMIKYISYILKSAFVNMNYNYWILLQIYPFYIQDPIYST